MFAGYDEDSKLFSAMIAALSCEKIRTIASETPTRAFPQIKTINGTVADPVVMPPASKMNGKKAWLLGSTCNKQISKNTIK